MQRDLPGLISPSHRHLFAVPANISTALDGGGSVSSLGGHGDRFRQKSKLPTEIFLFGHHGKETGWGLSFSAAAGGRAEAEVIAFGIRSDVEVAEMRRAVVRDGVCWRRRRSGKHHLPFRFRRVGWFWFLFVFVFGSVLVAVPCFREASKEESLKFSFVILQ